MKFAAFMCAVSVVGIALSVYVETVFASVTWGIALGAWLMLGFSKYLDYRDRAR